jgi:hypothetical protein
MAVSNGIPPPPENPLDGARHVVAGWVHYLRRALTQLEIRRHDRLRLGAGSRYIGGWEDVDIRGIRNLAWGLTVPLSLKPGTVQFIYSEHFVEHISGA